MVLADFQVGPNNPSIIDFSQLILSTHLLTSIVYFPRPLGANVGVQSTTPSATSAVGQLVVPGLNELNGQPFNIHVGGDFGSDTGDASGTVTVALYASIGTVAFPTYTQIATTGAVVPGFASAEPWSFNVMMQGTTSSGLCGGAYTAMVGGQKVGAANQSTPVLSGINFGASVPFGLVVGVTFGTGNSTNKARLLQFNLTQGY
jgi:hypothetical protein